MKSKIVLIPLIVIVVLVLLVASGVFYTLHEGEQAVITEFGRPVWATDCHCWIKSKDPLYSTGTPI